MLTQEKIALAAAQRAPAGDGTDALREVQNVTAGAASTDAQDTGVTQEPAYITMIGTEPFRVRFGTASVGAATSSDLLIPASTFVSYLIYPEQDRYFRAIREGGSDSAVQWYVSS